MRSTQGMPEIQRSNPSNHNRPLSRELIPSPSQGEIQRGSQGEGTGRPRGSLPAKQTSPLMPKGELKGVHQQPSPFREEIQRHTNNPPPSGGDSEGAP